MLCVSKGSLFCETLTIGTTIAPIGLCKICQGPCQLKKYLIVGSGSRIEA